VGVMESVYVGVGGDEGSRTYRVKKPEKVYYAGH
jgi:hypothetical protein